MSSNRLWRSKEIYKLLNINNEQEHTDQTPGQSGQSISAGIRSAIVENIEFEFIDNVSSPMESENQYQRTILRDTSVEPREHNSTATPITNLLHNDVTELELDDFFTVDTASMNEINENVPPNYDSNKQSPMRTENSFSNSVVGLASGFISGFDTLDQIEDPISDEGDQGGLVPYGFNSDSESDDSEYPKKSKKRNRRTQIQKSNWFAEKNRCLRETGKKYYGRKKTKQETWNYEVPREPKSLKNRCSCDQTAQGTMKCSSVTEEDRARIFKEFWNMKWAEKRVYVDGLITSVPVKRARGRTVMTESRRNQSFIYHLKKQDERIKVCRTMFLNTLGIGRWAVLNWKNKSSKKIAHNNASSSNRLREHESSTSKPFSKERRELECFLDSLPVMESHYCRATTQKKYLLPEWNTKRALYDFYKSDWCVSRDVRALSIAVFYNYFDSKNLALYFPKKDQCEKCALYKVGSLSEAEYLEHQLKKEEARAEKNSDKKDEGIVFTVDLQAVLMAPKSKISSLYYRTKLQVHNLTFYNLINKDGFCFLWNESEGGLNSEEFASIWVDLIEKTIATEPIAECTSTTKKVIFYSDGCTYQNRNCVMANALLSTAINKNIIIEQKFLEVGHTQMEADCMHSTIERALRNKTINVPADYLDVCRSARKRPKHYDVKYLTHSFFKKFDQVQYFKSIRPGRGKGDAKVTDIRALQYTPSGDIFYKLRFTDDWKILPQRKSSQVTLLTFAHLQQLHQSRRKITARKFEDLQYLKSSLPADYRQYYDNLPHE